MTNRGLFKGMGTSDLKLDNKRIRGGADPQTAGDLVTRNWSRGASHATPSYFPATATGFWDPLISMYNWRQSDLHQVRAALKKLATGVAPMHVFFLGDSTLIGYNGTTGPTGYNGDRSIPRQFGLALSYMLGGIPYVDGVKQAVAAADNSAGDRWVLTGTFNTQITSDLNLLYSNGVGTAKWSSIDNGTTIEFYVSNLGTTGVCTYSVDGAGAVSITTTGASTIQKITVSGLADTPHNVLFTTSSGNTWITGTRVYSPALTQLHCHNLAIGGARANSGLAGQNWSDTTSTSLQTSTTLMMTAAGITPDLVVICCGNNDAVQNVQPEAIIKGLTNMRNIYPNTPCLFIRPPSVPLTDLQLFDRFVQQEILLMDKLGCAWFSWDDWDNRATSYQADGLSGADNTHPIDAEAMAVARHLATQLAGPETYSSPMTAMATIDDVTTSGTTEQIVYQRTIPSWFWKVGTTAKVVMGGTCTSGTGPTLIATVRIGTAGTTSDALVAATPVTPSFTAADGWRYECDLICRSVGTSGTVMGKAIMLGNAIANRVSKETTPATVNTNVTSYLTVTLTPAGTLPVFVRREAYIDVPPAP